MHYVAVIIAVLTGLSVAGLLLWKLRQNCVP
jgi:hypothetical protein